MKRFRGALLVGAFLTGHLADPAPVAARSDDAASLLMGFDTRGKITAISPASLPGN
ncbi:MAG: hypothetical protein ABI369_12860 [Acetobacteraceae bacterium]